MEIVTRVLNQEGNGFTFEGVVKINGEALISIAKSKEKLVREKGAEFTQGAIPFWGGELVKLTKQGLIGTEVEETAIQVAMAAWLFEHVYGGLSRKTFLQSSLVFTMYPGGAVRYDRVPMK